MNSTSTQFESRQTIHADKTRVVIWTLLSAVSIYAILLYVFNIHHFLLHLIRPVTTTVAVGVLVVAAIKMQHVRRKRAWWLQSITIGGGAVFNLIYLFSAPSLASPVLQLLALLVYGAAIVGTGLYLRTIAELVGNSLRVILGAITLGCAFLILANIIISALGHTTANTQAVLSFIAFDIGTLFAVAVVASRHSYAPQSLKHVLICMLFLLLADSITLIAVWLLWDSLLGGPLYAAHSIFLASAAHLDSQEVHDKPPLSSSLSLREWVIWAVVPLGMVLTALGTAAVVGGVSPTLLITLVCIAIVHEAIGIWDYQRVTVALHKARLEAADVATMRERTRIARDFHDTIGAHLSGLTMHLRGAKAVLTADPARARESIVQAQQIVKEAATDVRSTIDALRMPTPSHRSLDDLITKLIERNKAAGIPTDFRICGTPYGLSASITEALYRVVQEGLTNIRKHAQATQVVVQLDYRDPRHVGLMIDDNGQGTDQPEGGFGFIGIQERVAQLNGTVQITTAPGQGLRLAVEVPV